MDFLIGFTCGALSCILVLGVVIRRVRSQQKAVWGLVEFCTEQSERARENLQRAKEMKK